LTALANNEGRTVETSAFQPFGITLEKDTVIAG